MRQTDYVILGLLSEAPMTGYQIKQVIDIRFRFFWSESYGQIYPALKSLCEAGLTEEFEAARQGARGSVAYRLTEAGLAALKSWLAQPVEKESIRLELLVKMYFSHLADGDVMLGHIKKFQAAHEGDLRLLEAFDREL